ncbi:MAG: tetratricopeptide repeat protein [Myxococcales bacterium]|jgi:tetratricopeptide (TPR) repeat protein
MSNEPIGRLKDRKPGGSSLEDRAGELLRSAGRAPALPPQQLERLWGRLAPALPAAGGGLAARAAWKLMLAEAVVVGGAVAVGIAQRDRPADAVAAPETVRAAGIDSGSQGAARAASGSQDGLERPRASAEGTVHHEAQKPVGESPGPEEQADRLDARGDRAPPPRADVAEPAPARAASTPSKVALAQADRRDAAARPATAGVADAADSTASVAAQAEPPRPVAAVEPAAADGLAAASALVRRAVEKLRVERDAGAALGILDDYDARFPNGVLANEARFARIDALLALGKRAEALEVLEKAQLGELPRHGELRVLRGELLAEAGRCREAVEVFTRELDSGLTGPLEERSLHGRAICRGILGDRAGSRADSLLYLERHPQGRFAGEVRKALGE